MKANFSSTTSVTTDGVETSTHQYIQLKMIHAADYNYFGIGPIDPGDLTPDDVGTYNFLEKMHFYKDKSKKAKQIFLSNGFDFAYADDLGNEIADGFYFTIRWKNLSGKRLLHNMLLFGLAGIPLSITGSSREGIRICVSLLKEDQLCELNKRVIGLANFLNSLE